MNDFQEYFKMLMELGECRKHYRNTQDLYAARYTDRHQKSHIAFKRLSDRFCRFGTVKQTRVKRRPIVNENNAADILASAALNPHASCRQMEKKSGISQRSVLRILHEHKFHSYRMSLYQDLYDNDFLNRVNFCNWIRRKMHTDVSFLSHVIFSGKANFAYTGNVNRHNMHYWANENPRWTITVPFQRLWIGLGGPVAWPPRSPDLTSPDHFLWGFVEECVMAVASTTPDDMKERILQTCTEITSQMLAEVRRSFHQRINKCSQVESHHFEHFL